MRAKTRERGFFLNPFRFGGNAGAAAALMSVTPYVNSTTQTTHTPAMPVTVNAGDLLILFTYARAASADANTSTPTGWTLLLSTTTGGGTQQLCRVYYKVASGSEGGTTVTITTASATLAAMTWRYAAGTFLGIPTASTALGSSTVNPDPPSHASGWSGENVTFIAGFGSNGAATPTTWPYPANQNHVANGSGTLPGRVMACTTVSTAGTVDPPVFVMAAVTNFAAFTISVRPAP